ncbi:hypothetical protein [Phaeocystidibacter luteus]|uniref:Uncharacterized protein n=1 Tax=Phaeocystidibacter luteus TaxID=911197 RepID=A0A6N6RDZ6_9FLAO|nr:hypothetical protein [Phaeocystidibacter luteus]KAB2807711.1 hypothetical protein F8C67_11765 [Phaeocystidibacter luteus]
MKRVNSVLNGRLLLSFVLLIGATTQLKAQSFFAGVRTELHVPGSFEFTESSYPITSSTITGASFLVKRRFWLDHGFVIDLVGGIGLAPVQTFEITFQTDDLGFNYDYDESTTRSTEYGFYKLDFGVNLQYQFRDSPLSIGLAAGVTHLPRGSVEVSITYADENGQNEKEVFYEEILPANDYTLYAYVAPNIGYDVAFWDAEWTVNAGFSFSLQTQFRGRYWIANLENSAPSSGIYRFRGTYAYVGVDYHFGF